MPDPKTRFTPEVHAEAVRLAPTSGRSRREMASDLGMGRSTLRNGIDRRRDRPREPPPPDRQEDRAAERKRLRRENEGLRPDREILTRAPALFAQEGGR
jgi:transposase